MKRQTTYRKPSIADQIAAGKGSHADCVEALAKLIRDGAQSSTLKLVRRAIEERFPKSPSS